MLLLDAESKITFEKGFTELLNNDNIYKDVLETTKRLTILTEEEKVYFTKLMKRSKKDEKTKKLFLPSSYKFGSELHYYLLNRSPEYRALH